MAGFEPFQLGGILDGLHECGRGHFHVHAGTGVAAGGSCTSAATAIGCICRLGKDWNTRGQPMGGLVRQPNFFEGSVSQKRLDVFVRLDFHLEERVGSF